MPVSLTFSAESIFPYPETVSFCGWLFGSKPVDRHVCSFSFPRLHFLGSPQVMLRLQTLRAEMRPTLRLALPLVLAEIGWMTMGIVDTVMVGHLPDSANAIGAVSISSSIFNVVAFFGGGLLIGLDTLVAQAFGAGQREDCHRSLVNGIYLSLVMTRSSWPRYGSSARCCKRFISIPRWRIS